MTAIVYQTNKQTRITYAYESVFYWDREKKQSCAKCRCIGRVVPVMKEIFPTRKKASSEGKTKREPIPITDVARGFYGATYLFDAINEKLGIIANLKKCFPDTYKQILSTAYYLILEDKNSLSQFPRQPPTIIPTGRIFLHRGVANCSLPLPKNQRSTSAAFRENDEQNRNIGHMIPHSSQVIPSACDKSDTV